MKTTVKNSGRVAKAEDTPSDIIVKAASASGQKVDKRGRLIAVRKLGPLQKLRLHEMVGANASGIDAYMQAAILAASVIKIGDDAVPFPSSKMQLEALVERLDEDGLSAVQDALVDMLGLKLDAAGNIVDASGEIVHAAKK